MLLPTDKTYTATKKVMQGKAAMNPAFKPLASWIDNTYHVKTINIVYEILQDGRPQLLICFETPQEEASFHTSPYQGYNKSKQQAIADQFKKTIEEQGLAGNHMLSFLEHNDHLKYNTNNVWVIFGAFRPIAQREAAGKVTQEELLQLQQSLHNEDLWLINYMFTEPCFFVYTNEQLKKYKDNPIKEVWADKYFTILKRYDEFGYFHRELFTIHMDSKENFDKNYQGNWYYYYK
jgi:hypothetical protein